MMFFPSIKKEKVAQSTLKTEYFDLLAHLIFLFFLDLNDADLNYILTKKKSSV